MYEFKSLHKLLDCFIDMGIPAFDIEVRHKGQTVLRRMHGYSDYENTKPICGNEKYFIYSCSKPITCAALMTLFEKGKFSLMDNVSAYIPEFADMNVLENGKLRKAERPITIKDLFTMTAGLTYNLASDNLKDAREKTNGTCPTVETMKYLAKDPLAFEPGERFSYSLCHDVIAALVEIISGEKFSVYVKKNIFDRLGMTNSTFAPTEKDRAELCAQYRYNAQTKTFDKAGPSNVYIIGTEYESGGAGCVSTLDDYMKFLEDLRYTGKVLSPETVKYMSKNHIVAEQTPELKELWARGYGYGLGVRCRRDDQSIYTDFGWGGAAAAYVACDRSREYTLYYAQHVLASPNQPLRNNFIDCINADLDGTDGNTDVFENIIKEQVTY